MVHFGPAVLVEQITGQPVLQSTTYIMPAIDNTLPLRNRISELEQQLAAATSKQPLTVETVKYIETLVEKPVEVIRYVENQVEVIVEKPIEIIKEIEKRVEVIVDRPVETIKHVEKVVETIIKKIPMWCFAVMGMELIAIIILIFK